jgi:bifunctional non-homologous end joining protein LigD
VAEIAFAQFTSDGRVRHASFLGLRQDKKAKDVKPERTALT